MLKTKNLYFVEICVQNDQHFNPVFQCQVNQKAIEIRCNFENQIYNMNVKQPPNCSEIYQIEIEMISQGVCELWLCDLGNVTYILYNLYTKFFPSPLVS